ncbi:MAG: metalloregulator ArsR/SmtB family transcription factor [Armatimonadota bacterium]|nr:metalloregulator ArsR/SmtB family transcription factor [bacterium]MDW8320180.1 metalloregulator ArsR/SmtB family transcription factor [Armatimonadota bacterium]
MSKHVYRNIDKHLKAGVIVRMDDSELVRIAKAIADPTRFAILRAIASREEISCGQLAELFPIAQATVSHHLNVLANAGLVEMRKQGQHHYFRLQRETVQQFGDSLLHSLTTHFPEEHGVNRA